MKNIYKIIVGLGLFFSLVVPVSYAGVEKYGEVISNRQITPIKDILANPKGYVGKLVTIDGKIDSECGSGCWFNVKVKDGNFVIYVDIGKSGFAIPQHTGKEVIVEGTVVIKESGPIIQGRGVEVK